jgi:hypothetical protein
MLLALATLGVTAFYLTKMSYAWYYFVPANGGIFFSLLFWITPPARKKARWRAALASLFVVPCMATVVAFDFLGFIPIQVWQVFSALTALCFMHAIFAIMRVKKKANHPWSDYYRQVA